MLIIMGGFYICAGYFLGARPAALAHKIHINAQTSRLSGHWAHQGRIDLPSPWDLVQFLMQNANYLSYNAGER